MSNQPTQLKPTQAAPTKALTATVVDLDNLPDSALLRESQIVPKRKGLPGLIPMSSPTMWRMVAAGTFPKPIKLTGRITCWKAGDIRAWLKSRSEPIAA